MLFFGNENDRDTKLLRDLPLRGHGLQPHRHNYQQPAKAPEDFRYFDVELKKLSLCSVDPETMEVQGIGSTFAPKATASTISPTVEEQNVSAAS